MIHKKRIYIKKIKNIPLKKNNSKEEKIEIKKYNNLINRFYRCLTNKKKIYDFEKFQIDIFEIIDSKYTTYSNIKKYLNIINNRFIIRNFIATKFKKLEGEYYDKLYTNKNGDNDEYNYEYNDNEFKKIFIEVNKIYVSFLIKLIDNIYLKFNKIDEDFILNLFTYFKLNIEKILIHLKSYNFKFFNKKNIDKLHYLSEVEYFYLLNNYDMKYIFTSTYIISNFNNIDNIIDKYFSNPDYNKIFLILINQLIEYDKLNYYNIDNVGEWILSKNISIDSNIKIKLYTLNLINLIKNYIDNIDLMSNDQIKHHIMNYNPDITGINNLFKKHITKKEFTLDQLIEADELIINILLKYVNFRKKTYIKYIRKIGSKNIKIEKYDYFLDYNNIVVYTGFNIIDINIFISFINKNRIVFLNYLINYIKKVTNINEIIHCKLFHNKNKIFTLDEKVNILKKIYSGKITASEIELFILNNNELACHFIKNISINNKYIKYALSVSNLNFIETISELKYNFTIDDLFYITSDLNLKDIIESINKYKTIDFFKNLDWYYHIKYILNVNNNNLDIIKVIYNDDNQDLRDLINKKINDTKYDYNFDELNTLNFNEFCIKIVKENIKLKKYDIYRLNCLQKRLFILNYEK